MNDILNSFLYPSNHSIIAIMLCLAGLRIFIEMTPFNPCSWPISKMMAKRCGAEHVQKFHKMGLYICIGQVVLWAPQLLFTS